MSTSETVTFDKGPCPCGAGHIDQHVTTQDNPWSTADIAYSINCLKCSREWRLDNKTLVLRSSEAPYAAAKTAEEIARRPLQTLVRSIAVSHFSSFGARSKKAAHAELERLGLTSMSYRQYLEHVSKGGTIATAASPLRNQRWLQEVAKKQGLTEQLDNLTEALSHATKELEHASSQVVRKKVA